MHALAMEMSPAPISNGGTFFELAKADASTSRLTARRCLQCVSSTQVASGATSSSASARWDTDCRRSINSHPGWIAEPLEDHPLADTELAAVLAGRPLYPAAILTSARRAKWHLLLT